MKIGLYGVSRAGKNYFIDRLLNQVDISTVNGSEILSRIAGIEIKDFKKLPYEAKNKYRIEFIRYLEKNTSDKHIIVDGHYSFIKEEDYEIAFTEADLNFYDIFFYLDTPSDIILDRLNSSKGFRKNSHLSLEEIDKWKEFEIASLKRDCLEKNKELIILDDDLDTSLEFMVALINSNNSTPSYSIAEYILDLNKDIFNEYDKILLLDCDKTLSIDDSTLDFFEIAKLDKAFLKKIFNNDRYSLYQFYKVSKIYSRIEYNKYKNICDIVYKERLLIAEETIFYINNKFSDFLHVGITSGIKEIWKNVKCLDLLVGGSYPLFDKFVMSDEVKRILAYLLKKRGKTVISIGDSMVDMPMLLESDKGYLVAYKKLNKSVQEKIIQEDLKIKQLKISKKYYDGLSIEEE